MFTVLLSASDHYEEAKDWMGRSKRVRDHGQVKYCQRGPREDDVTKSGYACVPLCVNGHVSGLSLHGCLCVHGCREVLSLLCMGACMCVIIGVWVLECHFSLCTWLHLYLLI